MPWVFPLHYSISFPHNYSEVPGFIRHTNHVKETRDACGMSIADCSVVLIATTSTKGLQISF